MKLLLYRLDDLRGHGFLRLQALGEDIDDARKEHAVAVEDSLQKANADLVHEIAERKRVVNEKDIGPPIATDMTRCIHCTRCVRFGEEIAGLRELGATGRGENMEIGTYVAHSMVSELAEGLESSFLADSASEDWLANAARPTAIAPI